jgi:hypothetical protein
MYKDEWSKLINALGMATPRIGGYLESVTLQREPYHVFKIVIQLNNGQQYMKTVTPTFVSHSPGFYLIKTLVQDFEELINGQ